MRARVLLPALILAAGSSIAQDRDVGVRDDAIAAPVILSVEDYNGAGISDNQAFVLITFEAVASASSYVIWREIEVNFEPDESGELIPLEVPRLAFIPWGSVDTIPGVSPMRVVVAVLDGHRGRWGVSSEAGWGHVKHLGRQSNLRGSR